jgi:putative membrane protein
MTESAHPPPSGDGASKPNGMRLRVTMTMAGVGGLALLISLIAHSGVQEVAGILGGAGWALLWVIPVHVAPIALDAAGWRVLLRAFPRASLPYLAWIASVRDAVNTLLPVARVGGEVAGVRLLMMRGVPGSISGASVMVEVTITLAVQFLFTVMGLVILLYYLRDNTAARLVIIGLLASLPMILVFFMLQHRWGLFQLMERGLTALTGRKVLSMVGDPARLDEAIRVMYRQRGVMAVVAFWQFAGLLTGAAELWFTLWLLGHPSSILAAILLESLAQAVQSAAFLVPGSLGVQEGSFVLFGAATGLSPDMALALSLARRVRQVGYGVPALLSWQWVEGRHLQRLLRRAKEQT